MAYKRMIRKARGKKAISEIVSYVLLISLALGMSALVYSWLKSKVEKPFAEESCPEGVSLVLESYNCTSEGIINITLRNRGSFLVDGFVIKMNNVTRRKGIPGMYALPQKDTGKNIIEATIGLLPTYPTDKYSAEFDYSAHNRILQVEIEPIRKTEKGDYAYCEKAVVSQAVCCPTGINPASGEVCCLATDPGCE